MPRSQLEVTDAADPAAAAWFFDCRAWLDAARGDGATERRLAASRTDPRTARARVQYQVDGHFVDGAGRDAEHREQNVHIHPLDWQLE